MKRKSIKLGLNLILALALALAMLPVTIARAETIWPCSTAELINAINNANANGEADTIMLDASCTYDFSSAYAPDPDGYGPTALPPISSDVTIAGNGATLLRSGGTLRFFYVTDAGSLTLENLTLSNGLARGGDGGDAQYDGAGAGAGLGGAIFNRGALTLSGVTLTGNTAQGGDGGDDVTVGTTAAGGGGGMGGNGQNAPGGNNGGAGGGINGGVGGTQASPNGGNGGVGGGGGGAAFTSAYGTPGDGGFGGGGGGGGNTNAGGQGGFGGGGGGNQSTTNHSLGGFAGGDGGRWAGGGGGGMGGAIFNDAGTVTINNSTLTGNTAQGGAGGPGSGTPDGDGGSGYGGALFNYNGTVTVNNATLANNTVTAGAGGPQGSAGNADGGGIYNYQDTGTASLTLVNTILADTAAGNTDCYNDGGTVTGPASNRNLIENNAAGANACDTPYSGSDPALGTLADNGGDTWTMALGTGSPAIDAVPVISCTLTSDQRAFARPQLTACDIGAYEAEALFLDKIADPTPLVTPGDTLTYTLIFSNNTLVDVTDVLITDVIPSELTNPQFVSSSGATITPTGVFSFAWEVEDLSPGAGGVIVITGVVDSALDSVFTINNLFESYGMIGSDGQYNSTSEAVTTHGVDLTVSKTVNDASPSEGDTITYTLSVFNNGPDDTTGVVISDALPLGVTYVSSSTTQGSYDSGTHLWTVGALNFTDKGVLTLTVQVDADTAAQTITNTALIDASDEPDDVTANNEDSAAITVAGADLEMSKTVDDGAPDEGDTIVYTLQVTNNGPNDATGVVVSDTLPGGVTYVSDDGGGAYTSGVWTVGALNALLSATLKITATVDADTAGSTITNTAVITDSDQPDSIIDNDAADAAITVTEIDLEMSKTVDDGTPDEGDTIVYTLQVTNNGPDDATGVVISDVLPGGVTYASDDGGGAYTSGVWTVGALNALLSATLKISATVDAGTAGSTITNTAVVTDSDQADPTPGNDEADAAITVTEIDLEMSKTVDEGTPDEGDTIVYTLQVTNNGPDDATGVIISDVLPSGVTYASDDGGGAYDDATGAWDVGALNALLSATLKISATVDADTAGSTITNTAVVSDSDQADPTPGNDAADAVITVTNADLEMSKTVDESAPDEGDTIVYTLQVTNNGPDDATGVIISDVLPSGVTYASDDGGGAYDDASGAWDVGALNALLSATLKITATVDADTAAQTIVNTAAVLASDQGDTVAGNNEADATITVAGADLAVSKTVDDDTPDEGDTIVYTLEVTNNGPDDATGVVINDILPSGVTYVSDDGGGAYDDASGDWTVGALNALASTTLEISAMVDSGTSDTDITNTAAVSASDQGDTVSGNNQDDATLSVETYSLEVRTMGQGTADKDPDQTTYLYGQVVTLTATADPGWSFEGWDGNLAGTLKLFNPNNPITVTMDSDKVITATFTQDQYTLDVTIVGDGAVSQDPDQATYLYGDVVTLTATADPGWTFDGWSGDLVDTANPITLTMDSDKAVTATFTEDQYTLDVTIVGSGTVTQDPDQTTYLYGDVVTLTATADTDWVFDRWSGDLTDTTSPITLTMDSSKAVTATFTEEGVCVEVDITALVSDSPVELGQAMHFTATVTGDTPISYTWDLDSDGTPEQSGAGLSTISHTYAATGTYTVTLAVQNGCPSTDTHSIQVTVNPPGAPSYGVSVSADDATRSGALGDTVTYLLTVRNDGTVEDSFDVSLSGDAWTTVSSTATIGPLAVSATDTLQIQVTIAADAADGATDTVDVTLTSQSDATASDAETLTTTAVWPRLFLPLVLKGR